jgi:hypothetical protein
LRRCSTTAYVGGGSRVVDVVEVEVVVLELLAGPIVTFTTDPWSTVVPSCGVWLTTTPSLGPLKLPVRPAACRAAMAWA